MEGFIINITRLIEGSSCMSLGVPPSCRSCLCRSVSDSTASVMRSYDVMEPSHQSGLVCGLVFLRYGHVDVGKLGSTVDPESLMGFTGLGLK